MKWGIAIALAAGLVAAAWLIWAIGFDAVTASVVQAGIGGLLLLCLYTLLLSLVLVAAWILLLPKGECRAPKDFYRARLVRDCMAEISPFSPVGGMMAAVRLMVLEGMSAGYAAASVAVDATTEAMAQVVFLAFGVLLVVAHVRHLAAPDPLIAAVVIALFLAVPGIAALILLQKKGADFAQRIAVRFFGESKGGASFRDAIHTLYRSPKRLAASSALHLLAWIGSGGGTFVAFRLMGGRISLTDAIALEALLCGLRSSAAFVPAALGVQEAGYAMLAPLFGLPAEMGLAVSLLKRAREIVIGIPALLYWQSMEGRAAMGAARGRIQRAHENGSAGASMVRMLGRARPPRGGLP